MEDDVLIALQKCLLLGALYVVRVQQAHAAQSFLGGQPFANPPRGQHRASAPAPRQAMDGQYLTLRHERFHALEQHLDLPQAGGFVVTDRQVQIGQAMAL